MPDQRKNPARMFAAFAAARRILKRDLSLVIAGAIPGGYLEFLKRIAAQCELPEIAVRFTGHVSDDELRVFMTPRNGINFSEPLRRLRFSHRRGHVRRLAGHCG